MNIANLRQLRNPGAIPPIVSYNASVIKMYYAKIAYRVFRIKILFPYFETL
jgi:hypothetical protein